MKKNIIYLLLLLTFLSCSEDKTRSVTIIGEDSATMSSISKLKGEYEEKTGVKVNLVALPFEEALEKSNLDLSEGTALYDIILQYNFSLSSFVRNDYVYSLDKLNQFVSKDKLNFENDLFMADWEEVGYYYKDFKNPSLGKKKVGYPFASNTMLLVYNKEMFTNELNKSNYKEQFGKELLPPTNWEDFRNIASFFTNKEKNQYGVCVEGAEGGWLYYQWVNMLFGMDGKVMDKERGWEGSKETEILLNTPKGIETMKYFESLRDFNKGSFYDIDMYTQKELVKEGNVAMSLMWSDILYNLIDLENSEESIFGFAPIPGNKSINAGGAYFVNKDSEHAEDAMNFIAWLMQKENQVKMIKNGLCSPVKSAYEDQNVQHIPYLKALKTSLERGVYMAEAGPDADLINQTITKYAQRVWRNELEPEQAMKLMQSEVEKGRVEIFNAINK